MAANTTTQCHCSTWEFGTYDPDTEVDETYDTGCTQTTSKVFAMGHDAKLVGFLVRAELAGEEISWTGGGMRHSFAGAVLAASKISEKLALKAQIQLDAARVRLAKKELAEARKASKTSAMRDLAEKAGVVAPVAPRPARREATVKIGRWVYLATIDPTTGEATYTNAKGVPVTVPKDKYTEQ